MKIVNKVSFPQGVDSLLTILKSYASNPKPSAITASY